MTGDDVRQVQRVLRAWYGLPPSFVDGFYGPGTVAIVKRAQAGVPPQPGARLRDRWRWLEKISRRVEM